MVDMLRRQSLAAMRKHGEPITVVHVTGKTHNNATGTSTPTTVQLEGYGVRDYSAKTLGDRYGAKVVEGSFELSIILEDMTTAPVVTDIVQLNDSTKVGILAVRPVDYQGQPILYQALVKT